MSLLTIEERVDGLKRLLRNVRSGSKTPHELVTIDAGVFKTLINDLVSLVEDEMFTENELYVIWQTMMTRKSEPSPMALALAERIRQMAAHRRTLGVM